MGVSVEFICKCKKYKCYLTEGQLTDLCPKCGRAYIGKYDSKNLTIKAKEVKRKAINNVQNL